MTDLDARNIIETDIKQKMLGPGYAKDIILCGDNAFDEIIPKSEPYQVYSLGVLRPQDANIEEDSIDEEFADIEQDDNEESYALIEEAENEDSPDDLEVEAGESSESDSDTEENDNNPMIFHIGLIVCLEASTSAVKVTTEYGTYMRLSWDESKQEVKALLGEWGEDMGRAIEKMGEDEKLKNALKQQNLPAFKNCFIIDKENGFVRIADNCPKPQAYLPIPNKEYPVEAGILNLLFDKHFKREQHSQEIELDLKNDNGSTPINDEVNLRWNVFEAKGKKFLKVIFQTQSDRYIYQPMISVTPVDGRVESYVEPITGMHEDEEFTLNEFIYRNVKNYGKGINCAVDWREDGQTIFTTFIPTVDIPKYSNEINDDTIDNACILRNLSIWNNQGDDELLKLLTQFVDGYEKWHTAQKNQHIAPQYTKEKDSILENQNILLSRLYDNIEYLKNNPEALECFKIANTAMLLQMVVARHPEFKKDREAPMYNEDDKNIFNNLDFFKDAVYLEGMHGEPKYRPFQLAFLLMNVKSTFEADDNNHKEVVDLIWFPTGGGKTEAYLALTALTITHRRRRGQVKGVSVIMRYTLRLLTTQQFERASYLICALEFLRRNAPELKLGNSNKISIGIYVGSSVTPNKNRDLKDGKYRKFKNGDSKSNPFPVSYCPWCGSKLFMRVGCDEYHHGYYDDGSIKCLNQSCYFMDRLPIDFTDENIYINKPTLLFATVDKFAQLTKPEAAKLLKPDEGTDAPDLIIQDELHLLIGALGSIVGLFETVIEGLTSMGGKTPKIIASTATTRNTKDLISKLYNRKVLVFPPMGLEYDDNYFSHIDIVDKDPKRRQLGMMPSFNTNSNTTEIRLEAFLILSRVKVFKKYLEDKGVDWRDKEKVFDAIAEDGKLKQLLDNYWSTVSYFNNLKDLGRSKSRVSQEVYENLRSHKYLYAIPESLAFLSQKFDQRVTEFTGRMESSNIKGYLTKAESRMSIRKDDNGNINIHDGYDMIFATNMISVGIDISRWNIMLMVGQPKSMSEYIQSSSRVARNTYGLVINLLNPVRQREHSLFENYIPVHRTYYKAVEPLSITPLTYATIRHKVINNIVSIFKNNIADDGGVEREDLAEEAFDKLFSGRFLIAEGLADSLKERMEKYDEDDKASALRDIASDAYISINQIKY